MQARAVGKYLPVCNVLQTVTSESHKAPKETQSCP